MVNDPDTRNQFEVTFPLTLRCCSCPNPRRGREPQRGRLRLCHPLHQGPARRLRPRLGDRLGRDPPAHMHFDQHNAHVRHRASDRRAVPHQRSLVARLERRDLATRSKRIRTQGLDGDLGRTREQEQ